MNKPHETQPHDAKIQSGPEIVADFIKQIKNDTLLDQPVVEALETLRSADKLTVINLLRSLEEARRKVGP